MSAITTHVLDLARGLPAAGLAVELALRAGEGWRELGRQATDGDGRARELLAPGAPLVAGVYRLRFDLGAYFASQGGPAFFPEAAVVFAVADPGARVHVPLLVSPYGYSTYRGS